MIRNHTLYPVELRNQHHYNVELYQRDWYVSNFVETFTNRSHGKYTDFDGI